MTLTPTPLVPSEPTIPFPTETNNMLPTGRPTPFPTEEPEPTEQPTLTPTEQPTPLPTTLQPTVNPTLKPTETPSETPTESPTKALHRQNDYDTAPDFADWDDFFESPDSHDLVGVLEDYSVVISFSGSRFFGEIIGSNESLDDVFHSDYHAFWTQAFDVNRTFIISDTTFTSTPVGVDFFEMRRRINSMLDPNIMFSYGPFGALIPLMDYQDTGFFHCIDETTHPSGSPSSSLLPTLEQSSFPSPFPSSYPSAFPSSSPTGCFPLKVIIETGENPEYISWEIFRLENAKGEEEFVESFKDSDLINAESWAVVEHSMCLPKGFYRSGIEDSRRGTNLGSYFLASGLSMIAFGTQVVNRESQLFRLPVEPEPSTNPVADEPLVTGVVPEMRPPSPGPAPREPQSN